MTEKEGVHKGIWQGEDLDKWYQTGPFDLPERCLRKVLAPEDLPASDGPPVGAELRGKFADTPWRGPLPHGADEDDDDAEIDLWTEETYRRRCDSLPAAIAIAAEAQSEALCLG